MANLLPKAHHEGLLSEYKIRLISSGLGMLAIALIVATLLLVPSFVLTEIRRQSTQSQLNNITAGTTTEAEEESDVERAIQQANEKLEQAATDQEFTPTDVVEVITSTKPDLVSVRNVALNYNDESDEYEVDITGTAATRDGLLTFRDQMRQHAQISDINLPISTLATRENTDFSLSLRASPPNQQ